MPDRPRLSAPSLPLTRAADAPKAAKAGAARLIVYNDDWHTFAEVIAQLVKATGCTPGEAEGHAWTVHTQGRAVVLEASRERCERAAAVLREIRLQVEVDWDA